MLIEAPAAKEKIERVEAILIDRHKVVVDRWFEMVAAVPQYAKAMKPTTRAGWIHDHLCPEVEAGVDGIADVLAHEALGFFALSIDNEILMRLKYVGQGAPSNVATDQQKLLARQEYDEAMLDSLGTDPALGLPTFLTCGYTLGDGELGRLEIRCDYKRKTLWSFDLYGGEAVSAPLEFPGMPQEALPALVKSNRETAAEEGQDLAEEA
jgi:hypothetical protein